MPITSSTLSALGKFDSPTICNVIELFDIIPRNDGYMNQRIQSQFPELLPMVGFATTAAFRGNDSPQNEDSYGSLEKQVRQFADLPGPAVVVFQDLDDPPVAATFGEVMCSVYKAFGSVGLITSGAGRDLSQVKSLEFPVFTGGTICSHGYCRIFDIGLPVNVGGLPVQHGDLLHGDLNGVVRIPLEIANDIPDAAAEFVAAESIVLNYVRSPGEKTTRELVHRQREFAAVIAKLTQRVRKKSATF